MTLTDFQQELCTTSRWDFADLRALYVNCTLKPSPELSHTEGSDADLDRDHGGERRRSRPRPRRRPRARPRRLAGHARPRRGARRLARAVRARAGGGHPRARLADLARREVVGVHARCRAVVRMLEPPQRARAVRVLRQGRRLPDHRQRGRDQALLDERPLLAPAPGVHDPAAGRRGLDRGGRARPVVPRRGLGRAGERLHEPEHDVHDLESAAPRAAPEGRGRRSRRTGTSARCGTRAAASTSPTRTTASRAALQLRGLGQLLQGAAPARAARARVRDGGRVRRRPLESRSAPRRPQPGAARPDARPRRRPPARRVERDPVVLRRRHRVRAGRPVRARAGAAVDVLRAVQPRALRRGRALPARVLGRAGAFRAAARPPARRWPRSARRDGARTWQSGEFLVGARYSIADISLYAYTHVAHEGDFDLAPYPAIRGWLGRVAAQPGHVAIDA